MSTIQELITKWEEDHDRLVQSLGSQPSNLAAKIRAEVLGSCIRQLKEVSGATPNIKPAPPAARQPIPQTATPKPRTQPLPEPQTAKELEALRPPKVGSDE